MRHLSPFLSSTIWLRFARFLASLSFVRSFVRPFVHSSERSSIGSASQRPSWPVAGKPIAAKRASRNRRLCANYCVCSAPSTGSCRLRGETIRTQTGRLTSQGLGGQIKNRGPEQRTRARTKSLNLDIIGQPEVVIVAAFAAVIVPLPRHFQVVASADGACARL